MRCRTGTLLLVCLLAGRALASYDIGRSLLAYPSPTEEPGEQGYLTLDLASCEATDPNPLDCNSTTLNPWYDPTATPPAIVYNPTNTSDRICDCGTVSELYIKTITSVSLYGSTAATYVADVGIVCNNGTSNFETFAYSGYGTGDTLVALSTSGVATAASVGYQAVTASINDYGLTGLAASGLSANVTCVSGEAIVGVHVEYYTDGTNTWVTLLSPICEVTTSVACTTVAPTTCSAGSYLDQSTNTCKQCGPGFYLAYSANGTYDNQAPCLACPAGTYQPNSGMYQTNSSDLSMCLACSSQSYAPTTGMDACNPTAVGYISNSTAATPCPAGQIAKSDHSACVACPAGYFRPGGDSGPDNNVCYRIPSGRYSTVAGTGLTDSDIENCPGGSYAAWSSSASVPYWTGVDATAGNPYDALTLRTPNDETKCAVCATGYVAAYTASSLCTQCKAGTMAVLGSFPNATIITNAAGDNSAIQQATTCDPCPFGTYTDTAGQTQCSLCAPGSATGVLSGATSCDACPDGFVNPAQGTTLGAGEGSISDYQSAVDTTAMTGYTGSAWNFLTGQIPANTVPTMSYAATSVGFWPTCQPCPVGYIQNSTALVCYKCTYGSTADTGNTQCDGCSAGAYWNGTQCVTVSIGQFAAIGATAASSCNAGTYSAAPGASACDVCPAGYYSNVGASQCTECSAGTYSTGNAKLCRTCPRGTFSKAGARGCRPCPPGWYQPRSGQASCLKAARGYYAMRRGNFAQRKCPRGEFAPVAGESRCRKCPVGQYQPLLGQYKCLSCCATGTSVSAGTCNLWTRGLAGQARCFPTRTARKML